MTDDTWNPSSVTRSCSFVSCSWDSLSMAGLGLTLNSKLRLSIDIEFCLAWFCSTAVRNPVIETRRKHISKKANHAFIFDRLLVFIVGIIIVISKIYRHLFLVFMSVFKSAIWNSAVEFFSILNEQFTYLCTKQMVDDFTWQYIKFRIIQWIIQSSRSNPVWAAMTASRDQPGSCNYKCKLVAP